jgi:hypothetical protein
MYDVSIASHSKAWQSMEDRNMAKIIEFRLPDRTSGGSVGLETPPKKEPIIMSVMPGQEIPAGHKDFRPILQRDGLILLGLSRWEELPGAGPHYVVHWLSIGTKCRHYATSFLTRDELKNANPQNKGRYLLEDVRWYDGGKYIEADYIYFFAPRRLCRAEVPGFIQELKAAGVTVDFDFHYSMDRVKKIQFAKEYLEAANRVKNG